MIITIMIIMIIIVIATVMLRESGAVGEGGEELGTEPS